MKVFISYFRLLSLFWFFSLSILTCLNQECSVGRLTQYPIHLTNDVPYGTCAFGPVYDKMPEEFKAGRVIAANQDYYNGFKTNSDFKTSCDTKTGVSCGKNCGQCVKVTGASGSSTYIIADICDVPVVGVQCAGDLTQFDLNTAGSAQKANPTLAKVADSPGFERMVFQLVPCTTTGNIGMYYPESGSNKWSVALVFYNYVIPLSKVEIQGAGSSVKTPNDWIELPRAWTNKFEWRGTQSYKNQSGDIYNGGDGFIVRLTSVLGEVKTYSTKMTIPSSGITDLRVDLNFQFDSGYNMKTDYKKDSSTCNYSGPYQTIYKDKVTSRISKGTDYVDCTFNSSGCRTYFEGDFLMEWWLVSFSLKNAPNPSYTGPDCKTKICFEMKGVNDYEVLIFGSSAKFGKDLYESVKFNAKMSQPSVTSNQISVTFDGCKDSVALTVSNDWKEYVVSIAAMNCDTTIKNLKFIFRKAESIYFDDISLDGLKGKVTDPSPTQTTQSSSNPSTASSDKVSSSARFTNVLRLVLLLLFFVPLIYS